MKWAASVENWEELSERSLRRNILREKGREEGEREKGEEEDMGRNREKEEDKGARNCEGDRKRNRLKVIYQERQTDREKGNEDPFLQAKIEREREKRE